jgi:hypothetical protein
MSIELAAVYRHHPLMRPVTACSPLRTFRCARQADIKPAWPDYPLILFLSPS